MEYLLLFFGLTGDFDFSFHDFLNCFNPNKYPSFFDQRCPLSNIGCHISGSLSTLISVEFFLMIYHFHSNTLLVHGFLYINYSFINDKNLKRNFQEKVTIKVLVCFVLLIPTALHWSSIQAVCIRYLFYFLVIHL